jgi:hypothetical protein
VERAGAVAPGGSAAKKFQLGTIIGPSLPKPVRPPAGAPNGKIRQKWLNNRLSPPSFQGPGISAKCFHFSTRIDCDPQHCWPLLAPGCTTNRAVFGSPAVGRAPGPMGARAKQNLRIIQILDKTVDLTFPFPARSGQFQFKTLLLVWACMSAIEPVDR